ncbi:MAG TPA: hypothetical protein VMD91_06080 [Candidatus Sulfotelmatobacter sp.]|nr:hypothetical protein [Candidatus Sulfotelmatobacter sp.]
MARPIMVAIAGDSGTGKSSLAAGLCRVLGEGQCAVAGLDGYFALDRAQRNAVGLTPMNPKTHDFAAMDEDVWKLANGFAINKPAYDHLAGTVAGTEIVESRPIVIVQGRFPLYTHVLRSLFDVTVWLEREDDLRLPWTVHRDLSPDDDDGRVRDAREQRRADYRLYVKPQSAFAYVRVRYTHAGVEFVDDRELPDGIALDADPNTEAAAELRRMLVRMIEGKLDLPNLAELGRYGPDQALSHVFALTELVVLRRIAAAARRAVLAEV